MATRILVVVIILDDVNKDTWHAVIHAIVELKATAATHSSS